MTEYLCWLEDETQDEGQEIIANSAREACQEYLDLYDKEPGMHIINYALRGKAWPSHEAILVEEG